MKTREPDLVANFYLTEAGIQVDVLYNDRTMSICRDFSGRVPLDWSIRWISGALYGFVVGVRNELEEMAKTRR